MKTKKLLIPAVIAAAVIGSCSWEMPQEVVLRGEPQIWIPTGGALFELDVSEEIIDGFVDGISDPDLVVGEKNDGVFDAEYDGRPLTLYAALDIASPTFPDPPPGPGFDAYFEDQTDPLDLSELSGPIPQEVELKQVPGWAWFDPVASADPDLFVRLRVEWDGGAETQYLLGDAANFASLPSSKPAVNTFDLAGVVNARPADLILYYEFGINSADIPDVDALHVLIEFPFALETDPGGALLDFEEDGENPLLMEEDIFGRDPADPDEELDDLLDALRGSNAGLYLTLTQTCGLGATLGMINSTEGLSDAQKKDPPNWVIDVDILPVETEQSIEVELTAQDLDRMIDGAAGNEQFIPEFLVLVPEEFQINSLWEIEATQGYLRVQAVIDYTFSLVGEE